VTPLEIRLLALPDAEAFLALRREALAAEPLAFSASPETDVALDPDFVRARLADPGENALFGAFAGGALAGSVGVHRDRARKAAHKAHVWGLYVRPAHRGRGAGAALVAAAIAFARALPGVRQLHLGVSESAEDALRLYRRVGFRVWGTEPAALEHGGRVVAEHHLVLPLA
jgi:hypothetical protein